MEESIKLIGVDTERNIHLYYDGKTKRSFVLTENFRITEYKGRFGEEVRKWWEDKVAWWERTNGNKIQKVIDN